LVGAIVGGLIGIGGQQLLLWEGRRERVLAYTKAQETLGKSLLFKVHRIYANLHAIHTRLTADVRIMTEKGLRSDAWQYVLPLAALPPQVRFTPEEMTMLLSLKDDALFNAVFDLDEDHNTLISAVETFSARRVTLEERLSDISAVTATNGQSASSVAEDGGYGVLLPRILKVNSLLSDIIPTAEQKLHDTARIIDRLGELLRLRLGLQHTIARKPVAAQTEQQLEASIRMLREVAASSSSHPAQQQGIAPERPRHAYARQSG
jgi:hypothetical protein